MASTTAGSWFLSALPTVPRAFQAWFPLQEQPQTPALQESPLLNLTGRKGAGNRLSWISSASCEWW